MSLTAFTADEILSQLDACAAEMRFPMLDNGYVYLGDVRLSGYADDRHWALLIEVLGFNPRADGIRNAIYRYGNCLVGEVGLANEDFITSLEEDPDYPAFDEEFGVLDGAEMVRVRGQAVPIPWGPAVLAAKGITLAEPPRLRVEELMRALLPEYRSQLLATEEELRRRMPADLPLLIRLDEWHHPDLVNEERPSDSPSFQSLAEVLVMGDPNGYRPHPNPNTHWKNWPEGGTL